MNGRVKLTPEQIRERISQSLRSDTTAQPASSDDSTSADYVSLIRLTLDQIEVDSDGINPRTLDNVEYANIRDSIEARGLDARIAVTKRPGATRYSLAAGGRTRMRALRELWEKTGKRQFFELDFDLRPFTSDVQILAGHISENLNRDDMCFWDKATSITRLCQMIEHEIGGPVSNKDLPEHFKRLGLPSVSRSLIYNYKFSAENLKLAGFAVYGLSNKICRDALYPGFAKRQKLLAVAGWDDSRFKQVWDEVLAEFGAPYPSPSDGSNAPWDSFVELLDRQVASLLNLSLDQYRKAQESFLLSPDSSWADLIPAVQSPQYEHQAPINSNSGAAALSQATEGGQHHATQSPEADTDRPPPEIVAQVQAEHARQRREEALVRSTEPPALNKRTPAVAAPAKNQRTAPVIRLAQRLAACCASLSGMVLSSSELPTGWFIEVPETILEGEPLSPTARQVFTVLCRASLQVEWCANHPEALAGTRFRQFVDQIVDLGHLVVPHDPDFLFEWLIDPAYLAQGQITTELLRLTRDQIAAHPQVFSDLTTYLAFDELQATRRAELAQRDAENLRYLLAAGANREMIEALYPEADLRDCRFTPGRPADISLPAARSIFDAWKTLSEDVANPGQRWRLLHEQHPQCSMASLYCAINDTL